MLSRAKFSIVVSSTLLTALLVIGAVMGKSSSADGAYRQIQVYTDVLSRIKSDYVEDPDIKQVTAGALQGLLESLDPYSTYLSADQYKEYEKLKAVQGAGVGLVVSKRAGFVFVLSVLPDSPAARAGLGTGDHLEAIERRAARDLPLPLIQGLLNGPAGTSVTLLVRRNRRADEPQELTLTRAPIAIPPVASRLLPDKVGYVQIRALTAGKTADVARALRELQAQGADRLVLDLRNNALGDLQEGIKLANLFIDNGLLAYLQGQKFTRRDFQADPRQAVTRLPMVVITNRATAGAAELTVAAIVDRQRGQIVGEKTYGLGAEQKTIPMEDKAAIILSFAKYYRPSGKAIQDGGIQPTLLVTESESDVLSDDDSPDAPPQRPPSKPLQDDELIKKAIEILKSARQA